MEIVNRATRKTFKSLVGQRFHRLVVVEYLGSDKHHNTVWLCRCDCGNEKRVHGPCLKTGNTKSCGCFQSQRMRKLATTHGYSRVGKVTDEFKIWVGMRARCRSHPDYAGRGISVCERWDKSFEAFLADMGTRPSKRHSIDRKDNDGNYEPGNCRWATSTQQLRNCRSNRLVTCRGETKTIAEWSEVSGGNTKTIGERLNRGWEPEKAIFAIPDQRFRSRFKGDRKAIA